MDKDCLVQVEQEQFEIHVSFNVEDRIGQLRRELKKQLENVKRPALEKLEQLFRDSLDEKNQLGEERIKRVLGTFDIRLTEANVTVLKTNPNVLLEVLISAQESRRQTISKSVHHLAVNLKRCPRELDDCSNLSFIMNDKNEQVLGKVGWKSTTPKTPQVLKRRGGRLRTPREDARREKSRPEKRQVTKSIGPSLLSRSNTLIPFKNGLPGSHVEPLSDKQIAKIVNTLSVYETPAYLETTSSVHPLSIAAFQKTPLRNPITSTPKVRKPAKLDFDYEEARRYIDNVSISELSKYKTMPRLGTPEDLRPRKRTSAYDAPLWAGQEALQAIHRARVEEAAAVLRKSKPYLAPSRSRSSQASACLTDAVQVSVSGQAVSKEFYSSTTASVPKDTSIDPANELEPPVSTET